MNEEPRNESTMIVNDNKMKTLYPVEVQAILNESIDVFPKDLPSGCHHLVNWITKLSWYAELSHPIGPLQNVAVGVG